MPGERELQCRYVPTAHAEEESAAAEWSSLPVAPERLARAQAGNAVSREARPPLELADGALGARAEDAVDGASVHAALPEADLERRDLRISSCKCAESRTRAPARPSIVRVATKPLIKVQNRRAICFSTIPQKGELERGIEIPNSREAERPGNCPILRSGGIRTPGGKRFAAQPSIHDLPDFGPTFASANCCARSSSR